MKLEVPFFKQTNRMNCGPSALRMVLAYFDRDYGLELIEEKSEIKEGEGIFGVQISLGASSLGYKTEFYSKQISFNKENMELEMYQKHKKLINRLEGYIENARKLRVKLTETSLSLEEILLKINSDCLSIVLLDWSIIKGEKEKEYNGHFVPIVGYDNENVYVHNSNFENPSRFLKIDKKLFNEARRAKGTDEDIIFIYGKKQRLCKSLNNKISKMYYERFFFKYRKRHIRE